MSYYNKGKEEKIKEMKKIQIIIGGKNQSILKRKEDEKKFILKCSKDKINEKYSNIDLNNKRNYLNNRKLLLTKKIYFFFLRKFLNLLIIFINNIPISYLFNKKSILLKLSEVTLKTNGTGTFKILSDDFFNKYNQYNIYK